MVAHLLLANCCFANSGGPLLVGKKLLGLLNACVYPALDCPTYHTALHNELAVCSTQRRQLWCFANDENTKCPHKVSQFKSQNLGLQGEIATFVSEETAMFPHCCAFQRETTIIRNRTYTRHQKEPM